MKKLLTCLCLTCLLVGGGVQLVRAQTATESTVLSQDQLVQLERERALKAEYQRILDEYITQENEFKETRTRYRRFGDTSLEPLLVVQAKNVYQLRDRTLLNYLNWVTELVKHYADNGEIVEETQSLELNLGEDLFASPAAALGATESATASPVILQQAILGAPTNRKTQKQVFLDQLTGLGQDIQEHFQASNAIVDLESWLKFNQDYGDDIIEELRTVLFPIYSYTLLSQVRDLVNNLPELWRTTQAEVLERSANQPLVAAEKSKVLNQLKINIDDLEKKVANLEETWSQVTTAGAYDEFREQVREITTLSAQVVAALKALY